jgi:hypothetical protein
MQTLFSIQALTVFVVSILVDIFWALYIRRSGSGHAAVAAHMAVLLVAFGAINVISYTENRWMLVPIILGSWLGTYGVIKWDHRNDGAKNVDQP